MIKDLEKNNKKSVVDGIILVELVLYIEEIFVEIKGVLVFKFKDLVKMYVFCL